MERIWVKSYAPGVPATIDFEEIPLHVALTQTTSRFPEKPALLFQGKTINYREFDAMVSRFAAGLKLLGVGPGDRVGLVLPNLVQTAVGIYGALRIGALAVPNNPLYTDRELEHQLNDSGCKVVLALDTLVPRMLALRERTDITHIISCHIRDYLPFPLKQLFPFVKKAFHLRTPSGKDLHEFTVLVKTQPAVQDNYTAAMDDTAVLIYTGGTTGVSKGVELTHGNLAANCQQDGRGL